MPYYPHHSKNRWPVSDGITKVCRKCGTEKPVSEFHKNRAERADGLQTSCKECSKTTTYNYRHSEKGHVRVVTSRFKSALKKYALTETGYNAMLAAQNYVCAICGQPERHIVRGATKRLAVDHCHTTGKVRGLLCAHCNQAIGRLNDDPELIRKAADYVERHK
jgi:uncharacterized Zn finger protein